MKKVMLRATCGFRTHEDVQHVRGECYKNHSLQYHLFLILENGARKMRWHTRTWNEYSTKSRISARFFGMISASCIFPMVRKDLSQTRIESWMV